MAGGHPDVKSQLLPTEEEQSAYSTGNRDPEDANGTTIWKRPSRKPEVQVQLAEIVRNTPR